MHSPQSIALLAFALMLCPGLLAQNPVTAEEETARRAGNEVSISDGSGFDRSGNAAPDASAAGADANTEPHWVRAWLRRVDAARASQPHFTAPIVTTHVMLVQQYRYDMSWQQDPAGGITSNYGAGRGLEIIPTTRLEVGISPPNYLVHQSNTPDGIGDLVWQIKFRAFSATEGKGDYFVGFFMGGTAPTGSPPNGRATSHGHQPLQQRKASVPGIFRARSVQACPAVEQALWADRSFSTPRSTIASGTSCGQCSSRTQRSGMAASTTARNRSF